MAGKRSFEEEKQPAAAASSSSEKRTRLVYSQVASFQWNLVRQFIKENNIDAAEDLLKGLSERDFAVVEKVAADGPASKVERDLLSHHRRARDEHTEMASLVLESSSHLLSRLPLELLHHQANSFLTDEEASHLAKTDKQTMVAMQDAYTVKGVVDAKKYLDEKRTGRDFGMPPTRFKNVSFDAISQLPPGITHIELVPLKAGESLVGVRFPWTLESLTLTYDAKVTDIDLQDVVFPSTLKSLRLDVGTRVSLVGVSLPEGLEHLSLGPNFNTRLNGVVFPQGLKSLVIAKESRMFIDELFDQSLVGVVFPSSLKVLKLGGGFNQSIDDVEFPPQLEVLHFGNRFNQSIASCRFPDSLLELKFGVMFRKSFRGFRFPPSLQVLNMQNYYGLSWKGVKFPASMKRLRMGELAKEIMINGRENRGFPPGMEVTTDYI